MDRAVIFLAFFISKCSFIYSSYVDPAAHIKFPSPILPRDDGHLPGHLEPLGRQRPPLGQITEYLEIPTPRELWDKQVKTYRPAVLRNALKGSPALEKWTDEYLTKEYGDQEVLIEKKYEDRRSEPKRMTIGDFLEQYEQHNWYVVTILPNVMRRDIKVPKPLMCSTFRENLQELNLWIGTRGTRSILHHDADNIMHCVVSGRKDWMLFDPENKPNLDMVVGRQGQGSGYSHLPVDKIDEAINPEVWDTPWEYVTLYGGDCLYLPPQYLHQVRSYNRTISSTFLFFPRNEFNDDDCAGVDLESYLGLNEVYVAWTYDKNQETVDMGYQNPSDVRNDFFKALNGTEMTTLTSRDFLYFLTIMYDDKIEEYLKFFISLYKSLDTENTRRITKDQLLALDMEQWKNWCRGMESTHGPTRTELQKDIKVSSKVPDFKPRPKPFTGDSEFSRTFLKFLIRVKGDGKEITYPVFKKWVVVQKGSVADAFVILDRNYNGVLTLEEVENLHDKFLRDFSKTYFSIKGTIIKGGGLYEDDFESFEMQELMKLNEIPEEFLIENQEPHVEIEFNSTKQIELLFTKLRQQISDQPEQQLRLPEFDSFVMGSEIPSEIGVKYFDSKVLFHFLDRHHKGYIVAEDLDYYMLDELPESKQPRTDFDDLHHLFEALPSNFSPSHFIARLFASMDKVYLMMNPNEKRKQQQEEEEEERKARRGKKMNKKKERRESDGEESEGESSENEERGPEGRDEL